MKKHKANETKITESSPTKKQPFYKNTRVLGITVTVVLLLIALFTSAHLRLATVDLRVTDRIAESNIQQNVINQLASQIRAQYPTLPDQSVQAEAQKRWVQYEQENRAHIQEQIKLYSAQIKAQYQFEAGTTKPYQQTYVLEMDPYLYWQWAENYADHGTPCVEGSARTADDRGCIDAKRLAPIGTPIFMNLHIWVEAQMIKLGKALNPNLHSLTIIFFVPVILGTLAVIPAFFIGRKLAGNIGGFVAAMIIATHPVLMNRTIAGFADTDGYNYLFPLLIIWFLFEALEAKHWWSRLSLSLGAGFFVGLYAFAWYGYFFTFFVLVVCFLALLGYHIAVSLKRSRFHGRDMIKGLKDIIEPASVFGAFLVCSALFVTLFVNFAAFIGAFTSPFSLSSNLQSATSTADALAGWPNILTTVAELNVPSLAGMVGNLGGLIIVVLAGFGLFVTLINPRKMGWMQFGAAALALLYYFILIKKGLALSSITFLVLFALPLVIAVLYIFLRDLEVDLRYSVFMMGWLLATLFAATKGIRFLLLGITPFAVGAGIAIGWIFIASSTAISKEIRKPILVQAVVGAVILLIVFNPAAAYNPITSGKQAAEGQFPGMNDAWWHALGVIREESHPDTIITSWWDFGHWFRNIANRSVTFDGASQNPEPGHIVGKILLSSNEKESLGLLRMMNCGQNDAYTIAHAHLDVVPAKTLIDEIVLLNKADAQKRLAKTIIPPADQQRMLELTHCTPPPAVFITSADMIGKAGVWGHFGGWDFRRAMAYDYTKKLSQSEAIAKIETLNYTAAEAASIHSTIRSFSSEGEGNAWISPWPGYFTQNMVGCSVTPTQTNATNRTASTNAAGNAVTCNIMIGIQQTNQGTIVLESMSFNEKQPLNATVSYALYANGIKASTSQSILLAKIVHADVVENRITRVETPNPGFTIAGLIRKTGTAENPQYAVLLADPLQVESLFTHLYFLDGAFTPHFTKFVNEANNGIVVWNVTWPKD